MRKIGLTIGKFMPLHKGHELMIDFGAAMLNEINVMVSGKETDEIPLMTRYDWVREKYKDNPKVKVHYHIDNSPTPVNVDKDGTVLDVDFKYYWAHEFQKHARGLTHIVTSDFYGQAMATLMNVEWLPVDPQREMVDISATKIRNDPMRYFNYISDVAKPYFVKKVAIVGPESTGKSTLVKDLALAIALSAKVTEYGRTLSESKRNDLTEDDFMNITQGQQVLIDIAVANTKSMVVISDTEAYTTYLFTKKYLGYFVESIRSQATEQEIDLYIVLAPTVSWVDDGTRVMGDDEERRQFFDKMIELLEEDGKNYVVIDDVSFSDRTDSAFNAFEDFLNQRLTTTQEECINSM